MIHVEMGIKDKRILSTISVILVVGGLILTMLGLVGEYVGRIYISINNCPQYVIREVISERSKIDV